MKKASKKGFTLIELMIVLAIIAILAMVLIPKAGNFKSQAKNSGVATNVNTVRAYLENKVMDNFISTEANVKTKLEAAYSGTETIKNPLTNDTTIEATKPNSGDTAAPVYVLAANPWVTGTTSLGNEYRGSVVVVVDSTNKQYTVYGVDNEGIKVNEVTVK